MSSDGAQPVVVADRLSKRYRLGGRGGSLRELFRIGGHEQAAAHWALRDVSFVVRPGEALGIIGPNGAGKTTVLKILSRITQPTEGRMEVHGRFSSLIELGAGFHPDLSGRENVFLNGAILGMPRAEVARKFDSIVDFAGIAPFIDTPVKRYSSGMYARLGFAVAAHVEPEVLLVDEILSVGDYAFQMKCHARMDDLRRSGTSLLFVSHNMDAIRRVCSHGLVLYGGRAAFLGPVGQAVTTYSQVIREAARSSSAHGVTEGGLAGRVMDFAAEIETVRLVDEHGCTASELVVGSRAAVEMDVFFRERVASPIFACFVRTPNGIVVANVTTRWIGRETPNFVPGDRCRVRFPMLVSLLDGEYELGVDITATDLSRYHDRVEQAAVFWVRGSRGGQGLVDLFEGISVEQLPASSGTDLLTAPR